MKIFAVLFALFVGNTAMAEEAPQRLSPADLDATFEMVSREYWVYATHLKMSVLRAPVRKGIAQKDTQWRVRRLRSLVVRIRRMAADPYEQQWNVLGALDALRSIRQILLPKASWQEFGTSQAELAALLGAHRRAVAQEEVWSQRLYTSLDGERK